jgi:hypothetical protein
MMVRPVTLQESTYLVQEMLTLPSRGSQMWCVVRLPNRRGCPLRARHGQSPRQGHHLRRNGQAAECVLGLANAPADRSPKRDTS